MIAWVLNLDAEDELALGGRAHTPSPAMVERIRSLLPRLSSLVGGDPVLFPAPLERGQREGPTIAHAWCPTRFALEVMHDAGITPAPHPPMDVLCRVNHRRFNASLGQTLPGALYRDHVDALPPGEWLLKRPYGYAGRGRRKVTGDALSSADRAFIAASTDGLQIEPWVERTLDCAIHGWLNADGTYDLGHPTLQRIDARGAWQSTERTHVLAHNEVAALHNEAHRSARALHAAGYFGPFNLDAFRWRDTDGVERFQPRSEINARFSMGWAIGMGDYRPR